MTDTVERYIGGITSKFAHATTSEYGYRTPFENLLKEIFAEMDVRDIGHDDRAKGGNKPDFVIRKNDVPLLYIEVKDFGVSLDKIEQSEQMSRYFGYSNLVLSDYAEFRFYRNGVTYGEPIKIASYDIKTRIITPRSENYEYLAKTLLDFTRSHKEPIKSGKHLAKIMGGKAQRIRDNIKEILASDSGGNSELFSVYETIKRLLVHDLNTDSFADMYAQTLVYGLFVARFYDDSLDTFTRQEARDLIPASNPFLGHFFDHIAGRNFEKRLSYIVDELCEVFSHADVAELMKQHFEVSSKKGTQRGQDQVIHFYEDFLKEYDEALRKRMGAYYTPLPVVQFIVRSVDYLLEKEFGLAGGLSDTTKTKDGLHKVQILDPAVGTGTFISDVIGKIYSRVIDNGQKGRWPTYVHHELLPRLYGFELMMAPYTIAHLKLSMALKETGFLYFNETRSGKARLGIYLTNSLEEVSNQPELLAFDFGASIAEEAKEAAKIKNEKPIMVVLGNPPYSVSSSNKGKWIQDLIKVYKENLNERKINLDDDYIKFIRFAEHFVEKNGSGIVAMITNNSFVDGVTHRQMRKHLLEIFDDIYVLNLHGDAKRDTDENVFDIQQGVSINVFVKNETKDEGLGEIYYFDFIGKREEKFEYLNKNVLQSIKWEKVKITEPYYFFTPKDFSLQGDYQEGFGINEMFTLYSSGIQTKRDKVCIAFSKDELNKIVNDFLTSDTETIRLKYSLPEDGRDWKIKWAKDDLLNDYLVEEILYRPFDTRFTIYTGNSKGFLAYPRKTVSQNFVQKDNIGLVANRQIVRDDYSHVGVTDKIICHGTFYLGNKGQDYIFPLYLHHEDGTKSPNLKKDIVDEIENIVGRTTPEDIFDYIYAVLHSPKYRKKYKEFLKIDFPRVPYPKDKETFNKLVKLGRELRELHLLESPKVNKFITTFPVAGSDTVEKPEYKDGNVYINSEQYFGNVPEVAWNFWVGGYQPAQKWLKDRKGRILTNEDIEHYQKMIVALVETDRIMKEIDER
ncbi:DNA methyltransferase [Candidatus Microgenomates bacterium]|nr:MAG: DNA methyltransferase [Candidatus Microgenomates bacterium]